MVPIDVRSVCEEALGMFSLYYEVCHLVQYVDNQSVVRPGLLRARLLTQDSSHARGILRAHT